MTDQGSTDRARRLLVIAIDAGVTACRACALQREAGCAVFGPLSDDRHPDCIDAEARHSNSIAEAHGRGWRAGRKKSDHE